MTKNPAVLKETSGTNGLVKTFEGSYSGFVSGVFNIVMKGTQVSGSYYTNGSNYGLLSGSLSGSTFSININSTVGGFTGTASGTLSGDVASGNWSGSSQSGTWTANRTR